MKITLKETFTLDSGINEEVLGKNTQQARKSHLTLFYVAAGIIELLPDLK